jgi:Chaperone of endosialidase
MYQLTQPTTTIRAISNSLDQSPLWRRFFVITISLALSALSPAPKAFGVSPPPDGGYPGNNTAEGDNALASLSSGTANTANGSGALASNDSGSSNTAIGFEALLRNTSGNNNTATGVDALVNNTTGHDNTANGVTALVGNTTGIENTATGVDALANNTAGGDNTATGDRALQSNTNGGENTANGVQALQNNTIGSANTATGLGALLSNTTANFNTANGVEALASNTTGSSNTAVGLDALVSNTKGNNNIALGNSAGANLTKGSNNIDIGNAGVAGESNKIRIGTKGTQKSAFIAGISGVTVAGGVGVVIDSNGQLGTATSSARFKDEIKPMENASEAILKLRPVSFRYKHELDPDCIPQFGLVAEQVEKVSPDLVARDEEGKAYTVRYEAVNAMLLNEFLKEHRKVGEQDARLTKQEATIAKQQKDFRSIIAQQQKQIEALTVRLQQVSDRLELNHTAPKLVNNQ